MYFCDTQIRLAVVICDVDGFLIISLINFWKFSSVLAVYFLVFIVSVLSFTEPVRSNFSHKLEKLSEIDN